MLNRALAQLLTIALLCLLSAYATAEDFVIPPLESAEANNATYNVHDAIEELRNGGFKQQAATLEDLLSDGRLYYQITGKEEDDNSAHTTHADAAPDGKSRIRLGHQHVSNEVMGIGDDPTRHSGGAGLVYRFLTVKTALHEVVHASKSLKFIQDGNFNHDVLRGPRLHELDAYRTSLKQYADTYVVRDIRDFLASQDSMNEADRASILQLLRAKVYALQFGLVSKGDDEVGPIGAAGDRACRWKAIEAELDRLFDDLRALRRDAKSRDACTKGADQYRQLAATVGASLQGQTAELSKVKADLAALRTDVAAREKEYAALRAELQDKTTSSARRGVIAQQVGDLDRYLSQEKPRLAQLDAKQKQVASHRKKLLERVRNAKAEAASIMKNLDNCRLNFVRQQMQDGAFPASQLPPDMRMTKSGKIEMRPKNDLRKIDIAATADRIEDMFDYDPDKIRQADDPRTPCYCGKKGTRVGLAPASTGTPSAAADGRYVIMLGKDAVPDVDLTDKSAGIALMKSVCEDKG